MKDSLYAIQKSQGEILSHLKGESTPEAQDEAEVEVTEASPTICYADMYMYDADMPGTPISINDSDLEEIDMYMYPRPARATCARRAANTRAANPSL